MRRKSFVMPKYTPVVDDTPKLTIYDHTEKLSETAKNNGHLLAEWKTFGRSYHSAYGGSNDTTASNKCILCNNEFHIDMYHLDKTTEIFPCPNNPNHIEFTRDENGIGITTWEFCGVCGKKLGSDSAKLSGICGGDCQNRGKYTVETGKWNKFYPLTKLPKEDKNSKFPIFNYVLVSFYKTDDGISNMQCIMMKDFKWTEIIEIKNVNGFGEMAVPRNVFVDIMQSYNTEDITISVSDKKSELYIEYKNSKTVFKGITPLEFPEHKQ